MRRRGSGGRRRRCSRRGWNTSYGHIRFAWICASVSACLIILVLLQLNYVTLSYRLLEAKRVGIGADKVSSCLYLEDRVYIARCDMRERIRPAEKPCLLREDTDTFCLIVMADLAGCEIWASGPKPTNHLSRLGRELTFTPDSLTVNCPRPATCR